MSGKKPSLGRGLAELSPLLAQRARAPATEPRPAVGDRLTTLPLDLLQRGKYQPRVDMRPETLGDLADSIKSQGVVQPILVRPLPERNPGESQRYEIIAGERRWRAAQMAGLAEIPAVGRSRAAVSNLLRLMELADDVKHLLEQRSIEMGHARALLGLTNRRQQIEVAALVAKKGLSVRDTEALVRRLLSPAAAHSQAPAVDPDINRLERELAEKLGAKVRFQHAASGGGRLVVSYHSLEELEGILAHIQ
jgi:ParB family chromosome partitioning protein